MGRGRRRTVAGWAGALLAGLVCLVALAPAGSASPGALDPSFGNGGMVRTAFPTASPGKSAAAAVLVQPDRKIVLVGAAGSELALSRYAPDGSLDPSFGDGGRVVAALGDHSEADAAVFQPDGEIVVAGSAGGLLTLTRYAPDGSLDTSFGDGGEVVSGLRSVTRWVALRGDGKILVAGGRRAGKDDRCHLTLARYEPAGSLDRSFGDGGEVTTRLACANAAVVQADGRVILAGTLGAGGAGRRLAIARYTRAGSLDASFGHGGWAIPALGGRYAASAAAAQPDGKLVLAASSGNRLALVRYTRRGAPDPSFGDSGQVVAAGRGDKGAEALLVGGDGKLVVAGTARSPGSHLDRFAVSRYRSDGSPDRSFGDGGEAISKPGRASGAALQGNGKLVVAGSAPAAGRYPGGEEFAALRLNDGSAAAGGGAASALREPKRSRRPGHRSRPPQAVPAFYINANSFKELKRFAATDACAFARTQPRAAHRTLILDFGGARAYQGGEFGAALNHEAFRATNEEIRTALEVASDAYATCHLRGTARIVYANTNHFKTSRSSHLARRIGVHQARTMHHVRAYQGRRGYRPTVGAGVGGDIEMGFWGPDHSKDLVNGAKSEWHHGYVDFGTAGGCPPYPKGVHLTGCFNGWRVRDVARVSHAGGGAPLPEVYLRGGPHEFDQAAEWATVARSWNARHRSGYVFLGATGSTEFSSLSPQQSWVHLRAKAPARVRRELLNFKQDQTLRSATAHGR